MKKITCFGEALIDFLNTGQSMEGPLSIPQFRQFPGGAPANVAVAIGKLGGNARFIGQVGNDKFGHFIKAALQEYSVDTRLLSLHPNASTALAFVFLDNEGERSFEFMRNQTADMLVTEQQITGDWFDDCDIFHFCSNTLTESSIAETTYSAIRQARENNCLVSFDINLRHNLWPSGAANIDAVNRCLNHVDILKVSREELDFLDPLGESHFVDSCMENGVQLILITDGKEIINIHAQEIHFTVTPPTTNAVDTTAAGDAFTGGFLYGLSLTDSPKKSLHCRQDLEKIALFASECGAYTVARQGAFTALPTLDDMREYLP